MGAAERVLVSEKFMLNDTTWGMEDLERMSVLQ